MNQSFDAARWWLLVGKHWSENRKKYTLALAAIAGLMLLWFLIATLADNRAVVTEAQMSTYYAGLFLVGCLYGSTLFADLGSKTRGLNYLTVPASHLEKLLCALFYAVVIFFVSYTFIFYALDFLMVKAGNAMAYNHWLKHHATGDIFTPTEVLNIFYTQGRGGDKYNVGLYVILFFFALQAIFICGSVYFAKFSLIKTIIVSVLAGLLFAFIVVKGITQIMPPGSYYHGLTTYQVYTYKEGVTVDGVTNGISIYSDPATDKLVSVPEWIGDVLLFLVKFAFAPLLWLATYYRLKEKEI